MNIALLPSSFHPHFGGVEELVRQLAHELVNQGHPASIFTNRWPKDLPANERFEELPVHRFVFRVPENNFKQMAGARLLGPATLRALCRQIRASRASVLHVQCISSNAHYALLAQRRLRLPLVATLQGELTMDAHGLFQNSAFAQDMLRRVLTQADLITACSAKTLADAEAFCGMSLGARGRVIFNAASTGDYSAAPAYPHPRPYIFALGRLVPQKGFDDLLRAFASLPESDHDLLIAGDGSLRRDLEQLASQLHIAARVHFLGRADRPKVASLFKSASFFVLPSSADEGLPVVCAEALAAGKAIVATRSGGTPEAVLHEKTGLIVDRHDVSALARAIQTLVQTPALRQSYAQAAFARSIEFSWSRVTQQYLQAYADAAEQFERAGTATVSA